MFAVAGAKKSSRINKCKQKLTEIITETLKALRHIDSCMQIQLTEQFSILETLGE